MRVLHVIAGDADGRDGAGPWAERLAAALRATGHDVRLLEAAEPAPSVVWGAVDVRAGVRVDLCRPSPALHALGRLRPGWRRRPPAASWSADLGRLVRPAARASDVVHLHVGGSPGPDALHAWLACRTSRRPLVVTPHADAAPTLLRRADAVVTRGERCPSLDAVPPARLLRTGGRPPADVPVPPEDRLRVRQELGVDDEAGLLLVFAGPCRWDAGTMNFVDAVRLLRIEGVTAVAAVLGASEDPLMRRLWRAALVPVHELPAGCGERHRVLSAADVVVLPLGWRWADAGDAWAAGTPVLAPEQDTAPTGAVDAPWCFPRANPPALARAIGALVRDRADTRARVDAARGRLLREPTWEETARAVAAVYERVCARH